MRFVSVALLFLSAGSVALAWGGPAHPAAAVGAVAAAPAAQQERAYAVKARRDAAPDPVAAGLGSEGGTASIVRRSMHLMPRKTKTRRPKLPKNNNNNETNETETESAASAALSAPLGRLHGYELLGYGTATMLFSLFVVVFQSFAL